MTCPCGGRSSRHSLGYSLALTARFAEAESLLREALEQSALMRMGSFHSQLIMWLSEARLLMGAVDDAGKLAEDALESTREKHEAGLEGWAPPGRRGRNTVRVGDAIGRASRRTPADGALPTRSGKPLPAGREGTGGARASREGCRTVP
jgi:hypothetical protein